MVMLENSVEFLLSDGVLLNNTDLCACQINLSTSVTVVYSLANFIAFESSYFAIEV